MDESSQLTLKRRFTLTLAKGLAVLEIPPTLSKQSHNALKLWLELMLKLTLKRNKAKAGDSPG